MKGSRHKTIKVAHETKWRLDVIAAAEERTLVALLADMAAIRYRRLLDAGWLMELPHAETLAELRAREGLPPQPAPLPDTRNGRTSVHVTEDTKKLLNIIAAVEGLDLVALLHDMAVNRYALMIRRGLLPDGGKVKAGGESGIASGQ